MQFKVNNILLYALIDAVIWRVCKYDMQLLTICFGHLDSVLETYQFLILEISKEKSTYYLQPMV